MVGQSFNLHQRNSAQDSPRVHCHRHLKEGVGGILRSEGHIRLLVKGQSPSHQCTRAQSHSSDSEALGPPLSQAVSIQSNNHSAVAYILRERCMKSRVLMSLTKQLLNLADKWGISLRLSYILGLFNTESDVLSRGREALAWSGEPTIRPLGSSRNRSVCLEIGASALTAFHSNGMGCISSNLPISSFRG